MAIANLLSTAPAPNTAPSKSAVRNLAHYSYGPMAVMTSPAFDNSPADLKTSAFAPADGMALDTEANG
jgi:bromodomain-containing factor 1